MNNKFFQISRENMIKNQIITNQVNSQSLIDAISEIERERFVPSESHAIAYSDSNILIKNKRFLMKAFIFAKMIQNCNIKNKDSILVIGCLTGYSVAIISKLCGYAFGVENDYDMVAKANNTLSSIGCLNCSVSYSNLQDGYKKNAPYDKIIIEGGIEFVPKAILEQIREGGEIFFMMKKDNGIIYEFTLGIKANNIVSYRPIFTCNSILLDDFISNEKNKSF